MATINFHISSRNGNLYEKPSISLIAFIHGVSSGSRCTRRLPNSNHGFKKVVYNINHMLCQPFASDLFE
jgi:hypothetical protein